MRFEKMSMCSGSYLIKVGWHDIIYAPAGEKGYFTCVAIRYDQRYEAWRRLHEKVFSVPDDVIVTPTYSSHKQFDGKLLGVDVIRKAFSYISPDQ